VSSGPIDPFEIIILEIGTVPTQICGSCLKKGEILAMPAFLFEWLCNEHTNQQIYNAADFGVTTASFAFGVGAIGKSAAWIRRICLFINAANLVTEFPPLNNFVQDNLVNNNFVQKELERHGLNSAHVNWGWNILISLNDVATIFTDVIIDKNISYISVFIAAWDIYKTTDEYKNLKNDQKQIKVGNIVESIKSLKPEE